jgi:hypothetical protein
MHGLEGTGSGTFTVGHRNLHGPDGTGSVTFTVGHRNMHGPDGNGSVTFTVGHRNSMAQTALGQEPSLSGTKFINPHHMNKFSSLVIL